LFTLLFGKYFKFFDDFEVIFEVKAVNFEIIDAIEVVYDGEVEGDSGEGQEKVKNTAVKVMKTKIEERFSSDGGFFRRGGSA
jgi:hypothetical protein